MLSPSARAQNPGANGPLLLHVDTLSAGASVLPPFVVAGWALDQQAAAGTTGIDAVDVWAVPASGGPVYLGPATLGGQRPDVAMSFGSSFLSSGFSLTV